MNILLTRRTSQFTSDGSVVGTGFALDVSCLQPDYTTDWVSMNVGATDWCAGETRNVSVTVTNSGFQSWTDGGGEDFNVGVKWNAETDYIVRVDAQNLAPGATQTYTFSVTAPAAGNDNLTFDVVREGCFWFANNSTACGSTAGPGNVTFSSPALTINALPTAVSAGVDAFICNGNSTNLSGSATAPLSTGSQTFTNTASICDGGNMGLGTAVGITTSGMPAGATITSITYSTSISGNFCGNWYETDFYVNGSYITSPPGCANTNTTYSALNGQPANGQVFELYLWDLDFWNDCTNGTISVTVNYSITPTITYSWSPIVGLSNPNIANPVANPSTTETYTMTASVNGCEATDDVEVTVDQPSTNPTGIDNPNANICWGSETTLTVDGGALGTGANWEWFEGSCGSTVVGTGSTFTASPSAASTAYYVRASATVNNTCPASACADVTINLPTTSTNLSVNSDNATCYVNSNNWVHFYNSSGRLIGSVNSDGQDLGNVTATSLVAGSPSTVTSCTQPWDPSWFNAVLARTFEISPTTQPTNPVSVRLYISQSEFDDYQNHAATVTTGNTNDEVATIADMGLTKHSGTTVNGNPANVCDAGTNIYVPQTASGNTSALMPGFSNSYYIEYSITGFSSFFPMNSGNAPLPVTLTSFNANCADDKVNVSWTTASEFNASHYSLQTSRDGMTWLHVAEIEAAGTTSQESNYQFEDFKFGGLSYYRLVQVDYDGTEEVYGPISVNCDINESSITVYPNPTDNDFTVLIQTMETVENANIELVDLFGRIIDVKEINILPGSTQIKFDTNTFKPGTYIVRVKGENDKFTPIRLVIM